MAIEAEGFGEWLANTLAEVGKRPSELASYLGIRTTLVQDWLSGGSRPGLPECDQIGRVLGRPAHEVRRLAGYRRTLLRPERDEPAVSSETGPLPVPATIGTSESAAQAAEPLATGTVTGLSPRLDRATAGAPAAATASGPPADGSAEAMVGDPLREGKAPGRTRGRSDRRRDQAPVDGAGSLAPATQASEAPMEATRAPEAEPASTTTSAPAASRSRAARPPRYAVGSQPADPIATLRSVADQLASLLEHHQQILIQNSELRAAHVQLQREHARLTQEHAKIVADHQRVTEQLTQIRALLVPSRRPARDS